MADKKDQKEKAAEPGEAQAQATDMPIVIHAQYVRDMSFENPDAPGSLRGDKGQPSMDLNIGMDARPLPDEGIPNLYEVLLNIRAEAVRDSKVVFIAELQYGVAVSIEEIVPEENHHPLLFIEIPRLSFPFARQIMADLTVQGGFPPLLLNPVDFHALYMQRFGAEIQKAQEELQKNLKDDVKAALKEKEGKD